MKSELKDTNLTRPKEFYIYLEEDGTCTVKGVAREESCDFMDIPDAVTFLRRVRKGERTLMVIVDANGKVIYRDRV